MLKKSLEKKKRSENVFGFPDAQNGHWEINTFLVRRKKKDLKRKTHQINTCDEMQGNLVTFSLLIFLSKEYCIRMSWIECIIAVAFCFIKSFIFFFYNDLLNLSTA